MTSAFCPPCLDILQGRVEPIEIDTRLSLWTYLHHHSYQALYASAEGGCIICRPVWETIPHDSQQGIPLSAQISELERLRDQLIREGRLPLKQRGDSVNYVLLHKETRKLFVWGSKNTKPPPPSYVYYKFSFSSPMGLCSDKKFGYTTFTFIPSTSKPSLNHVRHGMKRTHIMTRIRSR